MRVLLINSNRYKFVIPAIPFGMCYVASAVEKAGHTVKVLDLCFSKDCFGDIADTLRKFEPDLVGVSIRNIDNVPANLEKNTFLLDDVKNAALEPLKKFFTGPIVIGGTAVGISGPEMLEYLDIEYAIRGDGELAMVEFIKRLENKLPLKGLGGLIWRKGNRIIEDNPPWPVSDLDSLPHAKQYHYIDLKQYQAFESPIQVQTKRGCPHRCIYCTYNTIEGKKFRLRDPKKVADEIEEIVNTGLVNQIEFTDNTFNMPQDHCKAVLRAIAAKNFKNISFCTMGLNPKAIDEELVDLMKLTNFSEVDVGADSGSDKILKRLGKNYTKADILRSARILHEKKIPVRWFMLLAAPGETKETLMETFETMGKAVAKWDLLGLGIGVRIYSRTPIAYEYLEHNPGCTSDNFLHAVEYSPRAFPGADKALTLEEAYNLTRRMALRHPNYFIFEDHVDLSPSVLRVQTKIAKLLEPDQPVWKAIILMNTLQQKLGISVIKSKLFDRKIRKTGVRVPELVY